MVTEDLVCLGEIVSVHGIKGWVKIKTFTQFPDDLTSYGPLQRQDGTPLALTIQTIKTQSTLVASVSGCTTRNQAESLVGTKLYTTRTQLPVLEEDEFYYDELVGLAVIDENDAIVGTVLAVHNCGAGDFLDIASPDGAKVMTLPFNKESVPVVDIPAKKIKVNKEFLLF